MTERGKGVYMRWYCVCTHVGVDTSLRDTLLLTCPAFLTTPFPAAVYPPSLCLHCLLLVLLLLRRTGCEPPLRGLVGHRVNFSAAELRLDLVVVVAQPQEESGRRTRHLLLLLFGTGSPLLNNPLASLQSRLFMLNRSLHRRLHGVRCPPTPASGRRNRRNKIQHCPCLHFLLAVRLQGQRFLGLDGYGPLGVDVVLLRRVPAHCISADGHFKDFSAVFAAALVAIHTFPMVPHPDHRSPRVDVVLPRRVRGHVILMVDHLLPADIAAERFPFELFPVLQHPVLGPSLGHRGDVVTISHMLGNVALCGGHLHSTVFAAALVTLHPFPMVPHPADHKALRVDAVLRSQVRGHVNLTVQHFMPADFAAKCVPLESFPVLHHPVLGHMPLGVDVVKNSRMLAHVGHY
eukprot:Hpha_TRINITY_DN15840_c0_g1::TRINITY_DN15840_c0_g1_i2::g.191029::m.191029